MKKLHSIIFIFGLFSFSFFSTSCGLLDPCSDVLCQNGGTCVDGTCDCPDGVSGEFCDVVDKCYDVTCQNDGTCIDGTCDCPDGTEGEFCETKLSVQARLNKGIETPVDLVQSGISKDSLYGKEYAGGIIFFINDDPSKYPNFTGNGMVTTDADYGNFDAWGCYEETGATGAEVGDGPGNTQKIIDKMCSSTPSAKIPYDLVLEGYDDWFLPSLGEVDLMFDNLHEKGHSNFLRHIQRFQTSTEVDAQHFKLRSFYNDTTYVMTKISGDDIRPTRIY